MSSKKKNKEGEKVYTIPLKKVFRQPKTKRVNKAIKIIKAFLFKHTGKRIKMEGSLNEILWKRGRENPPREIKVKISEKEGTLKAIAG